jgi:hypothetical protein
MIVLPIVVELGQLGSGLPCAVESIRLVRYDTWGGLACTAKAVTVADVSIVAAPIVDSAADPDEDDAVKGSHIVAGGPEQPRELEDMQAASAKIAVKPNIRCRDMQASSTRTQGRRPKLANIVPHNKAAENGARSAAPSTAPRRESAAVLYGGPWFEDTPSHRPPRKKRR